MKGLLMIRTHYLIIEGLVLLQFDFKAAAFECSQFQEHQKAVQQLPH